MKQLIDAFDRAYIINLQDRTDRRRDVVREFQKIGIDVPNDKIHFYTATRPTELARFPSLGARGSFTSHRTVLDLALRDCLRNVLVFEDDVFLKAIDDSTLEEIVQQLARMTWDVVYFGYLQPRQD